MLFETNLKVENLCIFRLLIVCNVYTYYYYIHTLKNTFVKLINSSLNSKKNLKCHSKNYKYLYVSTMYKYFFTEYLIQKEVGIYIYTCKFLDIK